MTERKHNFTGKSDFFDWCNMHYTPETVIKKAVIFLGDAEIKKDKPEDLIPYYTHLISSAGCGPDKQTITLTRESWINIEEREHLAFMVYDAIKGARRAKKEGVKFNLAYMKKQDYYFPGQSEAVHKAVIDIVNKDPDIIKTHLPSDFREAFRFIEDFLMPRKFGAVHDPMHNRMREEFVEYARENGYAVFSWDEKKVSKNGDRFHPVIWRMCSMIQEYHKMEEAFGKR